MHHYDIGIDYRPRSSRLIGDTTVIARATQRLTQFDLDLQIGASWVRVDGMPSTWTQHGRELVISPSTPLLRGERFRVRVRIGDPGPERPFDRAVYTRGAMALEAMRNVMGNRDLQRTLRTWVRSRGDGNGSIEGFRRVAERVSGESLDHVFHVWLYTDHRRGPSQANGFPASML